MTSTRLPLAELTLVRCSPAQARVAVLNDPPEAPEDVAAQLARADNETRDAATWALVPRSAPDTLDLLSHCVTYRRSALVGRSGSETAATIAYGLAAVFTPPSNRGKGYARRMLQLLHYVLAPADRLPPYPTEWGPLDCVPLGDASFSFLHSGIDCAFYINCSPGTGPSSRPGWVPKPPHTRLWTLPASSNPPPPPSPDYEILDADTVASLQDEYERVLGVTVQPRQFAIIPDLSGLRRLGPPSMANSHFGVRLPTGWFTYLKLRPSSHKAWRITLSHVCGDVPFSAAADAARREGASVIEYGGEGFTAWDGEGVEVDNVWPKPCFCVYGEDQDVEWIAPEMLVVEGVGAPRHWAWY